MRQWRLMVAGSEHSGRVFVDFDGTIAAVDTTDAILERFADPAWLEIEADWKAGRIGSRECLIRQIDLVRATPAALDALLASFEIDPGFPEFLAFCRARRLAIAVVSDGLDRSVATVLRRAGIDLPCYANQLIHAGGDRWRLAFPNGRDGCKSLAGNCKCAVVRSPPRGLTIMVGDGRSDFCVAEEADLVLAKSALIGHCVRRRLPYLAFQAFTEATQLLDGWLDTRGVTPKTAALQ
jgi:2,3-diketo-5-methylthio-1-phosphopentane phosphatase